MQASIKHASELGTIPSWRQFYVTIHVFTEIIHVSPCIISVRLGKIFKGNFRQFFENCVLSSKNCIVYVCVCVCVCVYVVTEFTHMHLRFISNCRGTK